MAETETRLRAAIDAGDTTAINILGAHMDDLQAQKPKPQLLPSALWYASVGLHVFPLRPNSKIPFAGSKGRDDGTTDQDQIRAWWAKEPASNIGIATGHIVDIIDIDGIPGVLTWAKLEGTLPPVLGKVNTPRPGGTHLFIAAAGRGNRARLAPGVDYRGQGGYVVAPPSVLTKTYDTDGSIKNHPGTYTWTSPLTLKGAV
jgi:hypothetical protein